MISLPIKVTMIAAFVGALLIVRFYIAPAIVDAGGIAGVAAWIVLCLAIGKWLED